MDFERQFIINAFNYVKQENITDPPESHKLFDKNIDHSTKARQKGNHLFAIKYHNEEMHEEIWKLYTTSIAYAPIESEELAAGFANRSVLLLHLRKYEDALPDIERALKITQSSALKVKLFCRQAECYVVLQEGKQSNSLKKAKYWLNKVEDDSVIIKLNKAIKKAEQAIEDNVSDYPEKNKKQKFSCKNDAVTICYDEKYGRGLIATRDIEAGELVYIEKCYVTGVEKSKFYAYCSHCLGISWNLIPCEHCARYLYCSEKCKARAWKKYHDIECRLKQCGSAIDSYIDLSVRSLIIGIREAGSIKKLKELIIEIDNCEDAKTKGFSKDGKFSSNSFKSLYSLKSIKNNNKINADSVAAVMLTQAFAKFTGIFGKNFQYGNGENLMHHKDVRFISCLLLRLMSKMYLNAFNVQCMTEACCIPKRINKGFKFRCHSRGMCVSLFTSLINHSCDNNVNRFYTNDGKVVYYALKSIKRNSQIFSSYYCDYITFEKSVRQEKLLQFFEFRCDCKACQENWPTLKSCYSRLKENRGKFNDLTDEILHKYAPLIKRLVESDCYVSRKEIQSFVKDYVIVNAENTQEPNIVGACFKWALDIMMDLRYFDKLKIP